MPNPWPIGQGFCMRLTIRPPTSERAALAPVLSAKQAAVTVLPLERSRDLHPYGCSTRYG